MKIKRILPLLAAMAMFAPAAQAQTPAAQPQPADMTFFVTSAGPGKGGDLGGLDGADRYCQSLAQAVGAGGRTWRAYLSTGGAQAVNARDRIGRGPWQNVKGVVIAKDLDELHGDNYLTKRSALTEKGDVVSGYGDTPTMHDILTGSQRDGRAIAGDKDMTCGNWTSSNEGNAMLGHSDRNGGPKDTDAMHSWNSAHPSINCTMDGLRRTGGAGMLYCFATN